MKHGQLFFPLHYMELEFCADVRVEADYLIVMYHSIHFHGFAAIPPAETDIVAHYNLSGNNALNRASN